MVLMCLSSLEFACVKYERASPVFFNCALPKL